MDIRRAPIAIPALVAATMAFAAPSALAAHHKSSQKVHHATVQTACANADASAAASSRELMRNAVVCLIDQQRTTRHLPALRGHSLLDRSAQLWTNVMVTSGQFTHGLNFAARITAAGFVWSSAGENIATGFQTPRQVVTAWMSSPDHCRNILDPNFSNVGTGVNSHRLGQYGPSTWTQDFGLWMGHSAPSRNYAPQHGCPYKI